MASILFARKGYRFKGVGEVIVDGARFEEIMRFYRSRWVDTARSTAEPYSRIRACKSWKGFAAHLTRV